MSYSSINHYPSLTAVVHACIKNAPSGLDAKSLASLLGKPYQTLMSELSRQEGHKFGADLLLPIMHITEALEPLHFLARQMNGIFIQLPDCEAVDKPVHKQVMLAIKEFGELIAQTAETLDDGTVSHEERKNINIKGYEAIAAITSLLQVMEKLAK